MFVENSIVREIETRINNDIRYFESELTEEANAAWHGYIAALLEWNLISVEAHTGLTKLLNPVKDNPKTDDALQGILLGRQSSE